MAISNSPLSSYRGPAGTTDLSGILKQAQSATDSISEAGKKFIGVGEGILEKKDDASFNRARAYLNTLTDPTEIDVFRQDFLANADPESKNYAQLAKDIENQQQVGQERFLAQDKFDKTKRGIVNQEARDAIAGYIQQGNYDAVQKLLDTTDFNNEGLIVAELEKAKQGTDSSAFTAELSGTLTEEDARNVVIPESFTPEQRSKAQAEINARALSNKAREASDEDRNFALSQRPLEILQNESAVDKIEDQKDVENFIRETFGKNRENTKSYLAGAEDITRKYPFISIDGSGRFTTEPGATEAETNFRIGTANQLEKQLRADNPFLSTEDIREQMEQFVLDNDINQEIADAGFNQINTAEERRTLLSTQAQRNLNAASTEIQKNLDSKLSTEADNLKAVYRRNPVDEYITTKQETENVSPNQVFADLKAEAENYIQQNKTTTNQLGDNIDNDRAELTEINAAMADYLKKPQKYDDPDNPGEKKLFEIPGWVRTEALKSAGFSRMFSPGEFLQNKGGLTGLIPFNDTWDITPYKIEVESLMKRHVDNLKHIKNREEADAESKARILKVEAAALNLNVEALNSAEAQTGIQRR